MHKCLKCKIYTLKKVCPICNNETVFAHPIFKFSKYAEYRMQIKNGGKNN